MTLTSREIPAGSPLALPGQGAYEHVLEAAPKSGKAALEFGRSFAIGQDWSESSGLTFWYYGQNSRRDIGVRLVNDQTSDYPPNSKLVWSDEFNALAGTAPNAAVWGRDLGDGTLNGIPGWGNAELEYYTPGTANAATDGAGNLAITAREADGSIMCYYGPCEYTSARLLTKDRFEVAYGRLEARILCGAAVRASALVADEIRVNCGASGCALTTSRPVTHDPVRSALCGRQPRT